MCLFARHQKELQMLIRISRSAYRISAATDPDAIARGIAPALAGTTAADPTAKAVLYKPGAVLDFPVDEALAIVSLKFADICVAHDVNNYLRWMAADGSSLDPRVLGTTPVSTGFVDFGGYWRGDPMPIGAWLQAPLGA